VNLSDIFIGIFQILKLDFEKFVIIYNSIPTDFAWIFFIFFCYTTILIFLKFFGAAGLYIFSVIAIIVANIQLLKLVKFSFFLDPIPLGTVLFASTFLCTDILTEHYGPIKARKNVLIGFSGFLLMTLLMLFTLGFSPVDIKIQNTLSSIFLPLPIFFAASMIAYLSSQFFDIWFFSTISNLTNKRFLWLRNNVSTIFSSLLDNIVFSIFAWFIFNPNPKDFYTILIYIFGTYILRIMIAIIDTPFLYLSKYFLPNNRDE
tara:strand:- start:511 stop:1290 length:780 start_codon:yes stop_codon:yes gene_type:complete